MVQSLLKCPCCGADFAGSGGETCVCPGCGARVLTEAAAVYRRYRSGELAPVTGDFEIQDGVLKKYRGISPEVTVPDGVTEIGDSAFNGLPVTKVTLPAGVVKIGGAAFSGCGALRSITLSEGLRTVGVFAFYGCSSLNGAALPASVTEIGGHAFAGCTSLTDMDVKSSADIAPSVFKDAPFGEKWAQIVFQRKQQEEQARKRTAWEAAGRCRYCGGAFRGFGKRCADCGRKKDY